MSSTTLTIDQLCLSPFNVRTYRPDAEDTASLEDSILTEGLLNPIVCHPMRGTKGKFGAVAGGRRYRAITKLIARGALAADWPVRVKIDDTATEAELIEISITENLIRRDLRPHELYAGVARAVAKGHTVDLVAANLGAEDPAKVRRWLRIGNLAKPVFDAFAAERLTLDQAAAYAATEDRALQEAVFARFADAHAFAHTPQAIRLAMKVGDRDAGKLLRFVGLEAYRDAGGRFELDLFAEAEEERGRVADEAILARLVEAKLATLRATTRETYARPDLRFQPAAPKNDWDGDDYTLHVDPKRVTDSGPGSMSIPDGDIVGVITIDQEGEPFVSFWWSSRTAKFVNTKVVAVIDPAEAERPATTRPSANHLPSGPLAERAADAVVKGESGWSQDAIQIGRTLRRAILKAMLVIDADEQGTVATDYLVWGQLRMLAGSDLPQRIGLQRLGTEQIGATDLSQRARAQVVASGVDKPIHRALAELSRQSFFKNPDLVAAFKDYRTSGARLKQLAAAIVTGAALGRSLNAPGYALPIHDLVVALTSPASDETIRECWSPTVELLGLSPRADRIALVDELIDDGTRKRWAGLRNDQVTDQVLATVTAHADWVHPLLRFPLPSVAADEAADELQAAAE